MSTSNGQLANQTTFNTAYVSRTVDTSTVGKLDLSNVAAESGTAITNAQRELNSLASFVGKSVNVAKDVIPSWTSNDVGASGNDLFDRVDAISAEFNSTTGHDHSGAGQGKAISLANTTGTLSVAKGGTNQTFFDNNGVVFFDGTSQDTDTDFVYRDSKLGLNVADPSATIEVNGTVSLYQQDLTHGSASANIDDLPISAANIKWGGNTRVLRGIVATNHRNTFFVLQNDYDTALTVEHDSGPVTASARIFTSSEADVEIPASGVALFIRDTTAQRWKMMAFDYGGSNLSLDTFGSTPAAEGASISGAVLTLQPASATHPGGVSTTTQTFAGDKTFSGNVSVSESLAVAKEFTTTTLYDATTTGANATLDSSDSAFVVVSNASLTSLEMIPNPIDGKHLVLLNNTGGSIDIVNDTGATAANRILTGTGGDVTLLDGQGILLLYANSRWKIISKPSASGGGGAVAIGDAVGSGSEGSVLFVGSGNTLAQDNTNLFFDNTNNRLGVGTDVPLSRLHVSADDVEPASGFVGSAFDFMLSKSGSAVRQTIVSTGTGAGSIPALQFYKARGTLDTPTALSTNDFLGNINFTGFDGTNSRNIIRIAGYATAAASANDIPCALGFYVNNTDTVTKRLTIESDGTINVGMFTTEGIVGNNSSGDLLTYAPSAAFNYIAPTASSGDIIVHNGTTNTILAIGSTNQVLTVDTAVAGKLKYRYPQGRIRARYSTDAGQTIATGLVTPTIIDFEDLHHDTGSNVTTGASWKFTVPTGETGLYTIQCLVTLNATAGWAAGEEADIYIFKDGTLLSVLGATVMQAAHSTYVTVCGSDSILLNAAQYIDIRIAHNNGGNVSLYTAGTQNWVSIYKAQD